MDKLLIVFPHGIGDIVMATPAFRALRRKYPEARIDIAIQPVARSSGILDNCPYFNAIYTIHNPWFSRNYQEGSKIVAKQVDALAQFNQYQEVKWVHHKQDGPEKTHKVFLTAKELCVDIEEDTSYEVFITENDEKEAADWLKQNGYLPGEYAFVHTESSDIRKDIPVAKAAKMIPAQYRRNLVIVGRSFDITKYPLGFAVSLLKHSGFNVLVDSVFVHCCDALGKDIDIHITNSRIIQMNRPLHVKSKRVIENKFTKKASLKKRIQKLTGKLYVESKHLFRWCVYRTVLKADHQAYRLLERASCTCGKGARVSGDLLYIVGITVKSLLGQHIITRPYLCYLRKNNRGYSFLDIETADILPLKGIEHILSSSEKPQTTHASTYEMIIQKMNDILCNRYSDKSIWFGCYDLQKREITMSVDLKDHQILSRINKQEPFVSQKNIADFLARAVFST